MSNFKKFANAVNAKFLQLSATGKLFRVNTSKEELWATYQSSFPVGTNTVFRERPTHECNTCKSFINRIGSVVSIVDNQLDSIWNVTGLDYPYNLITDAMHKLVTSSSISSVFLTDESLAGREFNIEANEAGDIKWEHFYADINAAFVTSDVASKRGAIDSAISVFSRALSEFSLEALLSVEDLCDTIYKGEEFKPTVSKFITAKRLYDELPTQEHKTFFIWMNYSNYPTGIRNSAIGTLIININEGMELEQAVAMYEKVVAPTNYKRTTAVVTEGMKKQAIAAIHELGLEPSLPRRHATIDDITINNVLYANRDAKAAMKGSLDTLLATNTVAKIPTTASEITIEQFLTDILPTATNIEALVENRHVSNFVSLVAPINPDAPNMLKWNNNFSWSYNGEVTDTMKERVKAAGGDVTGILRCSIQWNEDRKDINNDLDLHCKEPDNGCHIYFSCKQCTKSTGMLDVDIQRPGNTTAVENITYQDISSMDEGHYKFYVNNFSGHNEKGFRAQIEFNGVIHEFNYAKGVTSNVHIADVKLENGIFTLIPKLPSSQSQRVEWNTSTLQYQKVSTIMLSPNFWDDQTIGNKHYFFMLEGCNNPSAVRGFYNEFLSAELTPHRKTFEMLSSLMKCEPSEQQLSGIGFSSTLRNNVHLKIDGRPYTITFHTNIKENT